MLDHVLHPPSMTHTQDAQGDGRTAKKEDPSHVLGIPEAHQATGGATGGESGMG